MKNSLDDENIVSKYFSSVSQYFITIITSIKEYYISSLKFNEFIAM